MKTNRTPVDKVLKATSAARRDNLRALIGPGQRFEQQSDLAKALIVDTSYLSQLIGPNPTRRISETTARKFELRLKLPIGSLDTRE